MRFHSLSRHRSPAVPAPANNVDLPQLVAQPRLSRHRSASTLSFSCKAPHSAPPTSISNAELSNSFGAHHRRAVATDHQGRGLHTALIFDSFREPTVAFIPVASPLQNEPNSNPEAQQAGRYPHVVRSWAMYFLGRQLLRRRPP
jgi:hypothetical protein